MFFINYFYDHKNNLIATDFLAKWPACNVNDHLIVLLH